MRRLALLCAIAAAVTGCGVGPTSPSGPDVGVALPPPPVVPSGSADPGPTRSDDGRPAGFTRDEAGAAAAATSYLSSLHALLEADDDARRQAVDAMAADGSASLVDELSQGFSLLDGMVRDARGANPEARLLLRSVPVAFTVTRFTDSQAEVEVWSLGVLVIEGATLATEVWSTNTVGLVWERGDWRLSAWSRRSGPSPSIAAVEPVAPTELLDAIEGWEGYRYVPSS